MPRCFYVFHKKKKYRIDIGVEFGVVETHEADKTIPVYQLSEIPIELQTAFLESMKIIV